MVAALCVTQQRANFAWKAAISTDKMLARRRAFFEDQTPQNECVDVNWK